MILMVVEKSKLKLLVKGIPKKDLEDNLSDLQDVGITGFTLEETKDGIICTFDKEEWDGSKTSTGCDKDKEGNPMDDAKLLQGELEGIIWPVNKEIKVTHYLR